MPKNDELVVLAALTCFEFEIRIKVMVSKRHMGDGHVPGLDGDVLVALAGAGGAGSDPILCLPFNDLIISCTGCSFESLAAFLGHTSCFRTRLYMCTATRSDLQSRAWKAALIT